MPLYDYECEHCGTRKEVYRSIHAKERRPRCVCNRLMDQIITRAPAFKMGMTPGRDSGFYAQDYGRRATEDLTVPGKMERLKKAGRIHDPFDDVPARPVDPRLAEDTFGDARAEELAAIR